MIKLEEFYKLREVLKDFTEVISTIDKNISRLNRNVDKIYKDIDGEYEESARDGIESHIDYHGCPQKIRELLSLNGFRPSPIRVTMILHARVE